MGEAGGARSPRWFVAVLSVVALGGLAIRIRYVAAQRVHARLLGDAYFYFYEAKLVAGGHGWIFPYLYLVHGRTVPAADHPPAFTALLVLARWVGITTPQGQRFFMCVVGTATVVVVGLVGRRLAGARAGVIAAIIAAAYPALWINDGMLMSETLFILAIACVLLFAHRIWSDGRWSDVLLCSLAATVATLTRAEAFLLFPFLVLPVVLGRRQHSWPTRLKMLGAAAAVAVVVMAPWVGYNLARFPKPVYLSTGAGTALIGGSCPAAYSGEFLGYYSLQCYLGRNDGSPPHGREAETDAFYRKRARHFISQHLGEVPKVLLAREGRIWGLWRPAQQERLDAYVEGRAGLTLNRWVMWTYWALLPLGVLGIVALRRWRQPLYLFLVQFGIAAFVAASTFGITRYRVGADVALSLLGACGIELLVLWIGDRHRRGMGRVRRARRPRDAAALSGPAPRQRPEERVGASSAVRPRSPEPVQADPPQV